jgi:large subunit ribosomal protein L6
MSRVGNKPIPLTPGVTVTSAGQVVTVKGPKGSVSETLPKHLSITVEGSVLNVKRANDIEQVKKSHGTLRAILSNAVTGVSQGFKRDLELVGIGYRAAMRGNNLVLTIGYSHEVVITPQPGVKISTPEVTQITVEGVSAQAVGETAAQIRAVRPPEPYQGKGIKYKGEKIVRKEGKRAAAAAAPAPAAKK